MSRNSKLTAKQRRFVDEYLKDLNATQAARRTGYTKKSAHAHGHKLLKSPAVQALIQERNEQRSKASGVTRERVLAELARIAFSDIGALFDKEGRFLRLQEMPEDARRALSSVEVEELHSGRGDERTLDGLLKKVKLWDKVKALDSLCKHLGLFDEPPKTSGDNESGEVVIKRRAPDGSEVEVRVGAPNGHRPDGQPADADAVGVPS